MSVEEESPERTQFLVELEFVQCLANPHYLGWLAQEGYFQDDKFVSYLSYLQYWKRPEYVKFIVYPHCLYFLDQLQHEEVRTYLHGNKDFVLEAADQQFYHWLYRRRARLVPESNSAAPAASGSA